MFKLERRQLKKQRLQIAFRDFWSFLVSIAEQYLRKTGFVQFKKPTKMILRSLWKTYAHKSQKLRTIVQKWSDLEFNLFHSFMETWVRAFLFCLFVCNMHLIFFRYWFGNNLHMKILLCQICICMINVCLYSVMHLCIRLSRGFTLG